MKKEIQLFFVILAITAFALALSDSVFSNYLKDAYNISAYQRGLIEFPRELPGILSIVIISALSFLHDAKTAIIAQILSIIGITFLGLITPPFSIMLIFLFLNSLGMHLFMPLQDSIGLSLSDPNKIGKRMGQFKGVFTAFLMIGSMFVFAGFKSNVFSFTTQFKLPFIIAALLFGIVLALLIVLNRMIHGKETPRQKKAFIFRKEYKFYYILAILFGVQKQIMIVYGPWVLIDLLGKKADTIALLSIIGGAIGIFFIPLVGRWLDELGIRKMLFLDALSFIGVYLLYGFLSGGFYKGSIATIGIPVLMAYLIFILDKMSTQMSLVRAVYLKSIAIKESDITPTLTLGMSMDHIVSITCAYAGGIIWTLWGPQYIFFLAAFLSLANLAVAFCVRDRESLPLA